MKNCRPFFRFLSLLALSILISACASSSAKVAKVHSQVSPEEVYKIMADASTPAEPHKVFNSLAGSWKASSSWQMSADAPAEQSHAVSKKTLVLNGLFLQENYKDLNPEQPFSGIGILGFDKVAGNYTSSWYDTMSSGNFQGTGAMNENNTIQFSGGGSCPLSGGFKTVESELQIINSNKHIFRMFDYDPDGKRYQLMQIVYTRAE